MATLRALLDVLSPALRTVTGETGLDREVTEIVVVGPGDEPPDDPGALLVCLDPERLRGREVAAAGIVLKIDRADDAAWAALSVPVLAADTALPWNHLLHLLATAGSQTRTHDGIGDLFALANAIAASVGGAVAIEDPHRRVLAYSSLPDQPIDDARQQGILGRQVPDLSNNDTIYRELQRSLGVVRFPPVGGVLGRLAVAVRSGSELLGSIWVVDSGPLPPSAEQALLDAGRLAGLHLLRARVGSDVERRTRGELLRALLDGRSAPELTALRLGLDLTGPVAVLGFGLPDHLDADDIDAEALADLVQLQCAMVRPRSSVLVELSTVYALVPAEDLARPRLLHLATSVVERAQDALRVTLRGAVGATVATLHEVARSRADVDAVLHLGAAGTVATVEDVLPQVVLLDLQAHLTGAAHLRLPTVDAMLSHDAEHGTPYAQSVLAYLAANNDVPAAAAAVNVHPNTFRYRLRRVRDLFDLDLEDPDVRLVAWLQLRTRR